MLIESGFRQKALIDPINRGNHVIITDGNSRERRARIIGIEEGKMFFCLKRKLPRVFVAGFAFSAFFFFCARVIPTRTISGITY